MRLWLSSVVIILVGVGLGSVADAVTEPTDTIPTDTVTPGQIGPTDGVPTGPIETDTALPTDSPSPTAEHTVIEIIPESGVEEG